MKNLDVFAVRYIPVVAFAIYGVELLCACLGRLVSASFLLFGNNALLAAALFIVSISNSRYHCTWNRCMYAYMIAVPIINHIDAKVGMFHTAGEYLTFFAIFYSISLLATLTMALRHYANARKRKKERAAVGGQVSS
jgi:hypothetical protein